MRTLENPWMFTVVGGLPGEQGVGRLQRAPVDSVIARFSAGDAGVGRFEITPQYAYRHYRVPNILSFTEKVNQLLSSLTRNSKCISEAQLGVVMQEPD